MLLALCGMRCNLICYGYQRAKRWLDIVKDDAKRIYWKCTGSLVAGGTISGYIIGILILIIYGIGYPGAMWYFLRRFVSAKKKLRFVQTKMGLMRRHIIKKMR